jgi:hypothetical protein
MVQMVMNGIGRGDARWDRTESFMRRHFCNTGGANSTIRSYYYGLFSFTKAMLLHDSNGDNVAEPITLLSSQPGNLNGLDWYAAEASSGAACDGVARTLVGTQNSAGYWRGHNYSGDQYPFETGWAIIMLNRTVFESGVPVAVAQANPNPAVVSQTINLTGAASFHQDSNKHIVSWAWDLDNNGSFETPGLTASVSFAALNTYPVKLQVCDDGAPQKCSQTTINLLVTIPPIAPTANAGGPYNFCLAPAGTPQPPLFLNGSGSVNPDEGQHQPGAPGDFITAYEWSEANVPFATGATPNVTAYFTGKGVGSYLIQLKVTDNTALSFPGSGQPNLSDTDPAQVVVKAANDPACSGCVKNLVARPKLTKVQLTWTHIAGTHHYNVYRGTTLGGPYVKIGTTTSTYSTYLDGTVAVGKTYYYVVRIANNADQELCQSNESKVTVTAR